MNKQSRILWLNDFYAWKKVDDLNYFSDQDYLNINGNVHLVKIDPAIAREHMWLAEEIQLFNNGDDTGFLLYQCDSPSELRKNVPIRFLYSKRYGKVFELRGTNSPFYSLFAFIFDKKATREDIFGKDEPWHSDLLAIEKYVRVFFDNVRGRHGRFEIIEHFISEKTNYLNSSYTLLLNRITNYYLRNPDHLADGGDTNVKFHRRLYLKLNEHDARSSPFSRKPRIKIPEDSDAKKKYLRIDDCHQLFKNSLFITSIMVSIDPGQEGQIKQLNERIISYLDVHPSPDTLTEAEREKLADISQLYPVSDAELTEIKLDE